MNKTLTLCLSAAALASSSGTAIAQDSDYHPVLSDNFLLAIGAFKSDSDFKIAAKGRLVDPIEGREIDFGQSVGVDESNTLASAQLRWKFGRERKWSLSGQYFDNNATGDATLTEDVTFEGITFNEGTFVDAGVDIAVARLFVGRSFVKNAQHDFGAGIGIHNLDIDVYIGGEIKINDETTGYHRADVGGSQILPNIGTWYNFSPAKRWLLHGRVDWISANINEYDGTMWNFNAGVNFQAWKHVGFDLSYQYFDIDLKVDGSDWIGGAKISYSGPILGMTFNW